MPKWIDAYEETPKTYTEKPGFDISDAVLVYGKDGYFIANFVEYLDDHDKYANGFRSCEDPTNWVDVEYWMPLPEEPYRTSVQDVPIITMLPSTVREPATSAV